MDFSHIAASGSKIATADISIEGLEGMRPVLTCKPAAEDNPPYWNALLKRNRKTARRIRRQHITVGDLQKQRDDDAELLSKHCVVGWSGVLDKNGKAAPFDAENCAKFFAALPKEIFDEFREDVANPGTFTEYPDADDVAEQAGNSRPA